MLCLRKAQFERLLAGARAGAPEEVCGLLAGLRDDEGVAEVKDLFPITNVTHGRTDYRMDPQEQMRASKRIAGQGWEIIGIYHTHPSSAAYPSATDVECAHWPGEQELLFPGVSYVILSLMRTEPEVRSFRIHGRRIPEDIEEERVLVK